MKLAQIFDIRGFVIGAIFATYLCSCVQYDYTAQTASGNRVESHFKGVFPGITNQQNGDGSSWNNDNQQEGQAVLNTVGIVAGAGFTASTTKAKNASDALTTQQAQKQASDLAKQNSKQAADAAAQAEKDKFIQGLTNSLGHAPGH